ncbi:MAG: hypothetical protein D4R90_03475 [Nitrosopumilales archaeon]|nr:MAG: hypothetical protein D4R90_03475 [Nitrosopumilales archaeon]
MRENLKEEEHIIASLPQIWGIALGLRGFFHKNKEGILVLTNKNVIFVPRYIWITAKEKERYFLDDKASIGKMSDYNESDLDEDLTENPKSWIMPLDTITDVRSISTRNVNFLRVTFTEKGKQKMYDFAITKTVTNYPYRQPLVFKNLDWSLWIGLIVSKLKP